MIYKVLNATPKTTTTGKPMKALELEANGQSYKVNIFSDFPDYANINAGSQIDGELKQNDKGYTNLYSNQVPERKPGNSAYKQKVIEETMERKEKSIAGFQDSKEWSIKVASTMNKAVDLAIAEIKDIRTLNTLENDILKWREWLWRNWDVEPTQFPPFES